MRRFAIFCGLAAASVSTAAAATVPPRAVLSGFVCHHAGNPLNREISITSVMRPVPGTQRMALKFELQRSMGGEELRSHYALQGVFRINAGQEPHYSRMLI